MLGAYYMQKMGGWVQIACKNAYVLNEFELPAYSGHQTAPGVRQPDPTLGTSLPVLYVSSGDSTRRRK